METALVLDDAGHTARLHVSEPARPGPGVVVLHPWWGLVDDVLGACDRLAAAGFQAAAPDLFHGQTAGSVEDAARLAQSFDRERGLAIVGATMRWLLGRTEVSPRRVGLLGFSLGGSLALRAAARGLGDCVVTFYGTPELASGDGVSVPVLGHFAPDDPYEPLAEVEALFGRLHAAGTPVTKTVWPGTGHWFMESSQPAWAPEAAAGAWVATVRFLEAHLRGAETLERYFP